MISNDELDEAARIMGIGGYRGTFSKDELPSPMPAGVYIVNMENSKSASGRPLPGTHWVLCDVAPRGGGTTYVDPFGVVPPTEICERAPKPIRYSARQVEDIDSELCGFICLYVLFQHGRGRGYRDILRDDFYTFPETRKNRALLDNFFGIKSK